MIWKPSSERQAARMRLMNAKIPRDGHARFWERIRNDIKLAGYKRGRPNGHARINGEIAEQLTIRRTDD